jgi:hypothetical protein
MGAATVTEPREYLGTVTAPYRKFRISGQVDTAAYAAGDVLFRNGDNEAFPLDCAVMGRGGLADLLYIVVREPAVAGAVIKPNIRLNFTDIGGTDYVPPAANSPFSGPTSAENLIGYVDILTAQYKEFKVSGATGYAIAFVPITESIRALLAAASDETTLYVTPEVLSGSPDWPDGTPVNISFTFILGQH